MKSINTVYKQIQMTKVLSRNTKRTFLRKKLQNLTDIDSYENIPLIRARIYHDYCKIYRKCIK